MSAKNSEWFATSKSAPITCARAFWKKHRSCSGHFEPRQFPCSAHTAAHTSRTGCGSSSCKLPSVVRSAHSQIRAASASPIPDSNSSCCRRNRPNRRRHR